MEIIAVVINNNDHDSIVNMLFVLNQTIKSIRAQKENDTVIPNRIFPMTVLFLIKTKIPINKAISADGM